MKRFLTIAAVAILALGAGNAFAVECALDNVPASTLLFPFVAYDYEAGDQGTTTLFSITNVSSEAQIVHITVWTDYSIAILDFNLTLTGYDVQTINIRDILTAGILPSDDTGANEWWDGTGLTNAGGSPFDDGPFSTFNELWGGALDAWFAAQGLPDPESTNPLDCDPAAWVSSPVNYRAENNGTIPEVTLGVFEGYLNASQTAVTGYRNCNWSDDVVFPNGTWFTNQEPRATWLYITADVVGACNKDLPDSDALNYFGAASGVEMANVLMGELLYLDTENNFSEAFNAVHLEANEFLNSTPATDGSGRPTSFYHRYHGGQSQYLREPLPTAWGFRYLYSPPTGHGGFADTWIRAWKGSTTNSTIVDLGDDEFGAGIAGAGPAYLYANSCRPYTYYAWDEDENVNSVGPGFIPPWSGVEDPDPIPVPNLFPLETQEVPVSELFVVSDADGNAFGWMMFIWPFSNDDGNVTTDQYQTWMGVKYAAFGQYTAGLEAAVLGNWNCDDNQYLPQLGIGMYSYSE
ncbi:MAG: hypothetical protein LJE93_04185 [Acidobacteria bacterium]|jgi:hypothetical protein|nr:hypothetical protein [Acidobacteriota bacterium]